MPAPAGDFNASGKCVDHDLARTLAASRVTKPRRMTYCPDGVRSPCQASRTCW
jgi:hypothetical protein